MPWRDRAAEVCISRHANTCMHEHPKRATETPKTCHAHTRTYTYTYTSAHTYVHTHSHSHTHLSTPYNDRRPAIAKMLLEYTIRGFCVTPKIAGTESNANTTSLSSTHTRHRNRGVASFTSLVGPATGALGAGFGLPKKLKLIW